MLTTFFFWWLVLTTLHWQDQCSSFLLLFSIQLQFLYYSNAIWVIFCFKNKILMQIIGSYKLVEPIVMLLSNLIISSISSLCMNQPLSSVTKSARSSATWLSPLTSTMLCTASTSIAAIVNFITVHFILFHLKV